MFARVFKFLLFYFLFLGALLYTSRVLGLHFSTLFNDMTLFIKKKNLVDAMLNPLRKNRIRIDVMPNSLLREINSLRSRCHALKLANIKYHVMIVVLCML
jgi:hypothetical protein